MKLTVIAISLIFWTLASHAQQAPPANPSASQPDPSQKTSSPNRTPSATWMASGKRDMPRRQDDKTAPADNAAIKWVDSTGRTIGRAIGNFAILASFDNELATLTGLGGDRKCDANRVCTYASNGARWSEFEAVYYTTADCSGTPYALGGALGTPYLGVPITDSGGTYLYLFKSVDTTRVTLNSRYSIDGCFVIGSRGAFPTDATPLSEVVPASNFGTPPFFLK